jgi:exodeoxyribonuclease VII small subunit
MTLPDDPFAERPAGGGACEPADAGAFDFAAAEPAGEPSVNAAAPAGAPASYEASTERLEAIIRRLDSGEAGLRETLDLVKEGRGLVEFCAAELDAVSQGLEELRLDELVARLEAGPAAAPRAPR